VGYAGGTTPDPTYHALGDHTETLQVDFDPERISYEELLDVFWGSHDPRRTPWSVQYKNVVFVHDEEQRRAAERTRERMAEMLASDVRTEILGAGRFYRAEGYHQKYRLRGSRTFSREYETIYPQEHDFVDSTAVARVNGYLAGHGDLEQLESHIDRLGLSPSAMEQLRSHVGRRRR
jgi:peptide-methionine (S)-S-oxide reductase